VLGEARFCAAGLREGFRFEQFAKFSNQSALGGVMVFSSGVWINPLLREGYVLNFHNLEQKRIGQ
jgi:hypothetical protein